MNSFVAFLDGVKMGATGVPMCAVEELCEKAGLIAVKAYFSGGNLGFRSHASAIQVKTDLTSALKSYTGKNINVVVRTASELNDIVMANPFPEAVSTKTVVVLLDAQTPKEISKCIIGKSLEEVFLGNREIYIHYAQGKSTSKLKLTMPGAVKERPLNTLIKLACLANQV